MGLTASIIRTIITLMTEAASTPETSVNFYQTTRRNNPEDSHLHTRRHENLKSQHAFILLIRLLIFQRQGLFSVNRIENNERKRT
jgi:hypothetical protein